MGAIELLIVAVELVVLVAIVSVLLRKGMTLKERLVWLLAVLVLNVLGAIAWFVYLSVRLRRPVPMPE
jgi:hypothetical protein